MTVCRPTKSAFGPWLKQMCSIFFFLLHFACRMFGRPRRLHSFLRERRLVLICFYCMLLLAVYRCVQCAPSNALMNDNSKYETIQKCFYNIGREIINEFLYIKYINCKVLYDVFCYANSERTSQCLNKKFYLCKCLLVGEPV